MESVIISDFGVTLGQTSERLVVRGARPRFELIEGGPQLLLPIDLPRATADLRLVASSGVKEPAVPLRPPRPRPGHALKPPEIEVPFFRINEIVVASRGVSLSTDLIEACCQRGIRLCFLGSTGQPYAMLSSPMLTATVQTRRAQMLAYLDERGVEVIRSIVRGKLRNQANLLKYFGKYQKQASPETFAAMQSSVQTLARLRRGAIEVSGRDADGVRAAFMAIEGAAGRAYWAGVRALLGGESVFSSREHRGATDPINSALNYGYGILYAQVWGALMNAGLEPFGGFLHVDRPGKPSLVLDFIEEFRQPIVDRAVIALVTRGADLRTEQGLLTGDGRRTVAGAVLERLEAAVGFRGRDHRMKSVIQAQARRLAVFLRGDGHYRTFAFKW